jgi:hypothetical protein
MAYQQPKANHPWRTYPNKRIEVEVELEVEVSPYIPVREFIKDLNENWDKIEVVLNREFEGSYTNRLCLLPQAKQAAWIAGQLKRFFAGR